MLKRYLYSICAAGNIRTNVGRSRMILRKFLRDESGATAIEYGLIAACISIAIIVVAGNVGDSLNDTFTEVQTELDSRNTAN